MIRANKNHKPKDKLAKQNCLNFFQKIAQLIKLLQKKNRINPLLGKKEKLLKFNIMNKQINKKKFQKTLKRIRSQKIKLKLKQTRN
jgi:hypothetical protein